MDTEVYVCNKVPPRIPEFVDSHVTREGKNTFIIEVNPHHEAVVTLRQHGVSMVKVLTDVGFKGATLIYKGERPSFSGN